MLLAAGTVLGPMQLGLLAAAGQATVRVSNTGPMVSAAAARELSQPFRRLGGRTTHRDGHGLDH